MQTTRAAPSNTGYASAGLTCKIGALCFYLNVVLFDSFLLRNPPGRKARICSMLLKNKKGNDVQ